MVVNGLDGTPYWKKPEEQLPTVTRMYYVYCSGQSIATALYSTETGKWTIFGKEVIPLIWGDPYFYPET